ncbi:MAG: hypothetical protein ACFCVG_01625 [Kineosporiaceae bacterium]
MTRTATLPPAVRGGAVAVVAGALVILASELVETFGGGYSDTTFTLLIVGRAVLGAGIWALHRVQARSGGLPSLLGAALLTVAMYVLSLQEILAWGARSEAEVIERAGPIFWVGIPLVAVGGLLFGLSVVRARVLPLWTGAVPLAALVAIAVGIATDLEVVISVANMAISASFLGMGAAVLTGRLGAGRASATPEPAKGRSA